MIRLLTIAFSFLFFTQISSQNPYFLPNKKLNPSIPSPEQFFGYAIGSHHTRHDKMVEYMKELDRLSDKVTVKTFGQTNEHRDQISVIISSPENMAKLETLRKEHLDLCDPTKPMPDVKNMPVFTWLGYNVHGNEPSGGEAAILTAYYLVASEDEEAQKWLKNAVIILEPTINPDGRDRHSHWANSKKGLPNVADPNDTEHNEVWPGGRFNHYYFDLNRDWYLVQQVESRNRLKYYHQWLPNVVTDHHEMGTNANFFFEPSKQNAENDLVPKSVYRDLNLRFAPYFEQALNEIGSLYGTKELFDNFYPGYGSSYPDIQGGLGLLFEQASSRGHVQESRHGLLTFAFTIRNQLVSALATVRASVDEREYLLKFQHNFYTDAVAMGQKSATKAYIVGDANDAAKNRLFWDMLLHHNIEFYHISGNYTEGGQNFKEGKAVVIPTNQPQYLMIRSIFDKQTSGYKDSLFYDASTWNLGLAYGVNFAEMKTAPNKGKRITTDDLKATNPNFTKSNYAYLVEWTDYFAPKLLYQLHENEIMTQVASKPFTIKINGKSKTFGYGTLIIPARYQKMGLDSLYQKLVSISQNTGVPIESAATGFSESGPDLGTTTAFVPTKPQVAMVVGTGVAATEAGEIWHLMDTKIGMPITKIDVGNLARMNLNRYNTLIMVGGAYPTLDSVFGQKLRGWMANGNTLILLKGGTEWAIKNKMFPNEKLREPRPDTARNKPRIDYDMAADAEGAKQTGGAIFEANLDITNPIGYGYTDRTVAIYRNNNTILERSIGAANSVLMYTDKPLLSGYVHPQSLQRISGSAAINVVYEGQGRAILFTNDPNFRSTWFGTSKLFYNSIFFGGNIGGGN